LLNTAAPCISVVIFEGPSALEKVVTFVLSLGNKESFAGAGLGGKPAGDGEARGAVGDGDDGVGLELLPTNGGLGDAGVAGVGLGLDVVGAVLLMMRTGLSTAVVSGSMDGSGLLHKSSEQHKTFW
jgi:hypothetical protein